MTMPHKISIPDFIQNMIEFVQAWPQIKQTACPVIEVTIEFSNKANPYNSQSMCIIYMFSRGESRGKLCMNMYVVLLVRVGW